MSNPSKSPRRDSGSDAATSPSTRQRAKQETTATTALDAAIAAYPDAFQEVYPIFQDIRGGSRIGKYLADLPAMDGALKENEKRDTGTAETFTMKTPHRHASTIENEQAKQDFNQKMKVSAMVKAIKSLRVVLGQASGTPRPYVFSFPHLQVLPLAPSLPSTQLAIKHSPVKAFHVTGVQTTRDSGQFV